MPRRTLIAANWKMHKTAWQTHEFLTGLVAQAQRVRGRDVVVFPPFPYVVLAARLLDGSGIHAGGQDLFWEAEGAFTGEVSGTMLADAGARYVIVGHSERRHLFGENDEVVSRKLAAALRSGLVPIFCVGEMLSEREAGRAEEVVSSQIDAALSALGAEEVARIVVAYEPVWAIGTGRTATPDDAQSMHLFIRRRLSERFGGLADDIRVLYGGSVKPKNAGILLAEDDIDGALVGGASLDLESFLEIVEAAPGPR